MTPLANTPQKPPLLKLSGGDASDFFTGLALGFFGTAAVVCLILFIVQYIEVMGE